MHVAKQGQRSSRTKQKILPEHGRHKTGILTPANNVLGFRGLVLRGFGFRVLDFEFRAWGKVLSGGVQLSALTLSSPTATHCSDVARFFA